MNSLNRYYTNNSYSMLQADIDSAASVNCPEKIYLDVTEDCNLHCQMCRDCVHMDGKTMPMKLFTRIVDETAPYCKSYSLFNWGELLVLSNWRDYVRYVYTHKRPDCNIELSTNGMLLDDETIDFLRANEVRVIVSFDGADKATFEKIRCGANFERICKNSANLNRAYEDVPLDIATASYTAIQRDNQGDLTDIVKAANKLGFRRIGFGLVTAPSQFAPEVSQTLLNELQSAYNLASKNEIFLELFPTKIGAYVYGGDRYVSEDSFVVRTRCDAPLVNSVIRYDGAVCLCCNYGDVVGNVNDGNFLELWKSAVYDRFREAVNCAEKMPKACKNCWWVNRCDNEIRG